MDWLTQRLFPNDPKMVRYRKLEVLYIAVLVVVCAAVGVMILMLSTKTPR